MKRLFSPSLAALCLVLILSRTWDVGYRVVSPETLLAIGVSMMLAATMSLLTATSAALRMAALGLMFFCLIATYFIESFWLAYAVVVGGAVGMWFMHKRLQPHFFVAFSLIFLVSKQFHDWQQVAVESNVAPQAASSETQILVHLVMDEMGSFESLPEPYRVQAEVKQIKEAYEQRGFQLYLEAPSNSPETNEALSSLVDIGSPVEGKANVAKVVNQNAYKVVRNSLHRLYADQGWNVSITQSSYLDFCTHRDFSCRTYQIGRNAFLFSGADLPALKRAQVFGKELLAAFLGETGEAWRRATPTLPLSALSEMDLLVAQTSASSGRRYVFGHFLLPHFPWILGKDCNLKSPSEWQLPYKARLTKLPADQAAAIHAYWQQAYCTHRRILHMVDILDAAHPGKVRFLIHGDHGPRILRRTLPAPGEEPSDEETRRNVLEPFIASRMESVLGKGAPAGQTMQAMLQSLLISEAAVKLYGKGPAGPRP